MILNVTTVYPSITAVLNCPTVVVVGGGDAGAGGQAEVGRSTALCAVAVINDNALIGVCCSNGRAGRIAGLDKGVAAAGSIGDGLSFILILIGEAGVGAVVGSYEQNVCGTCVPCAGNNDGLFLIGDGSRGVVNFVADTVVVGIVHTVNGEEETVLREIGEAVLIDIGIIQCSIINSADNVIAVSGTGLKSLSFSLFENGPYVVELLDTLSFGYDSVNALGKGHDGDQREDKDSGKHE